MPQRILVVDDEPDVRECVFNLLSLLPDTSVEAASSYTEGRAMAEEPWDLVISDYVLPDGNGLELLAACERAYPEVPRLLMSAYEGDPQVAAALATPTLTGFIQKPFDPEVMLGRVERLLAGTRGP